MMPMLCKDDTGSICCSSYHWSTGYKFVNIRKDKISFYIYMADVLARKSYFIPLL